MHAPSPDHLRWFRVRVDVTDWRGWLPTALELTLALLLAMQVARLLWLALTPTGPIGQPALAAETLVAAPRLAVVDVFFRQMTGSETGTGTGTALGYTLFGVRRAGADDSSAILGKDDQQASYAVGREIAPGIVLDSVGASHAVLTAKGARHRIELQRHRDPVPPLPATLPVGAPQATAAAGAPPTIDPRALLAEAGLRANDAGGYTLIPRGDGALLRQVGLKSGDILLSVNGQALDPERLGELKDELKGQSQVTIRYRRDGKTHTTTLKAPR